MVTKKGKGGKPAATPDAEALGIATHSTRIRPTGRHSDQEVKHETRTPSDEPSSEAQ